MAELSPQQFFLRYAFPCAYVLVDQGRLRPEDYEFLRQSAIDGKDVPFEDLEQYFPAAFRRIKEVARRLREDYRSLKVIKHYFLHDHNEYIDMGDGMYARMPETFCEFCKVKTMPVLEKKVREGSLYLLVAEGKWVEAPFFKPDEITLADKVIVHHAVAVELVK